MAVLYITEFTEFSGRLQAAPLPPLAQQTVAIGGASALSAVLNVQTRYVRLHADVVCSIAVGTNPTAVATGLRLGSNQTEYFAVASGQRIAVITNT